MVVIDGGGPNRAAWRGGVLFRGAWTIRGNEICSGVTNARGDMPDMLCLSKVKSRINTAAD